MDPLQREIYRKMTPEQKLKVCLALYHSAYMLNRAAIEKQHPERGDKQVLPAGKKALLYAVT